MEPGPQLGSWSASPWPLAQNLMLSPTGGVQAYFAWSDWGPSTLFTPAFPPTTACSTCGTAVGGNCLGFAVFPMAGRTCQGKCPARPGVGTEEIPPDLGLQKLPWMGFWAEI